MSWQLYERMKGLISEETGAVKKSFGGKITFALCYPNTYQIGMSNIGFQKIYSLLNLHADILCERVFLPSQEDVIHFQKENIPLFSLESQTPVHDFDIVAFSVTFESDYINILRMLSLSHIPIRSSDRNGRYPLILMGGICATFNPEPLSDFIDVFFIGEGDEAIAEIVEVLRENSEGREGLYKRLSVVEGVYVPSGYEITYNKSGVIEKILPQDGFPQKVKRRWVKDLNKTPTSSRIITSNTIFGDMYLIEVGRGCGKHCRFCLAGYSYRPPRNYSAEVVLKDISEGLKYRKKIGLVGSAICDNPEIDKICEGIERIGGIISVSSLRLDKLSERLIKFLSDSGHRTATIAP
ncbi:MAG: B12-binding domain-containing radical SAM protein, partial [Nitrospinae bacterium]|nr:B12-binding domain-containing radical SAM protein [Nitrospinota bacterium]